MLVRTDGGANFISGEKKLRTCIKKWNRQRIREYLLRKEVRWLMSGPGLHSILNLTLGLWSCIKFKLIRCRRMAMKASR